VILEQNMKQIVGKNKRIAGEKNRWEKGKIDWSCTMTEISVI